VALHDFKSFADRGRLKIQAGGANGFELELAICMATRCLGVQVYRLGRVSAWSLHAGDWRVLPRLSLKLWSFAGVRLGMKLRNMPCPCIDSGLCPDAALNLLDLEMCRVHQLVLLYAAVPKKVCLGSLEAVVSVINPVRIAMVSCAATTPSSLQKLVQPF